MSGVARIAVRPLGKLVGIAASGVLGVTIVESFRSGKARRAAHGSAVTVASWGLKAQRKAEVKAEELRLGFGDILAEARERVGETARPPAAPAGHDGHDHEH